MAKRKIEVEESALINRFIIFYTLRFLWKENNRKVNELYEKLFQSVRSGSGNKTLYDNILRLKQIDLSARAKELSSLIDINEQYILGKGNYKLTIIGFSDSDKTWKRYIQLRQTWAASRENRKGSELTCVEEEIKKNIRLACQKENFKTQSEVFKRLVYFATYGQKKSEKRADELFAEIERAIGECTCSNIERASAEKLEEHYKMVLEYAHRLDAILTLTKWR